MANRDGEFSIVFQPMDPDLHLVDESSVRTVLDAVTAVITLGLEVLDRPQFVSLFHATSPEYGSVRFNMVAATAALAIAADASQVVGLDVKSIFEAAAHALSFEHSESPTKTDVEALLGSDEFRQTVSHLADVAAATGMKSVRLEVPGVVKLELVRPTTLEMTASEFYYAKQRLVEVEDALSAVHRRLDDLETGLRNRQKLSSGILENMRRSRSDLRLQQEDLEWEAERLKSRLASASEAPNLRTATDIE